MKKSISRKRGFLIEKIKKSPISKKTQYWGIKLINALKYMIPEGFWVIKTNIKKLQILMLIVLVNVANFAVAAAPSGPVSPTHEKIAEITSLKAISALEGSQKVIKVTLTAYSSTADQTDDTPWLTAANTVTRDGIVAANFLPLYTKIRIPELFGDKIFVVEDRMHSRFNDRVDIWFANRSEAEKFGLRKATIQVL